MTYDDATSNDKKLLVVVRGCKIITFKKLDKKIKMELLKVKKISIKFLWV